MAKEHEKEIWKDIKDYEGLYQVSSIGRVKSLPRNTAVLKILKPGLDWYGYLFVVFCKNGQKHTKRIHRLVLESFVPRPPWAQLVHHKNDTKLDNTLENLEWATYKKNSAYRRKPVFQLTLDGEIVGRYTSATQAAKITGINATQITNAVRKTNRAKTAHGYRWEYA